MLKKTITYEDFNGEEVNEDFFFHLSKAELIELEMSHEGGLSKWLESVIAAEDGKTIISEFKKIVLGAYGVKSEDGRRFIKNQTLRDEFESSEAYSVLFVELVTDAEAAAEFVNGIIPQGMVDEAVKIASVDPKLAAVPGPEIRHITQAEIAEMPKEEFDQLMEDVREGKIKIPE